MSEPDLQRDKQIMLRQHLKARGIVDPRLIDAMATVAAAAAHREFS